MENKELKWWVGSIIIPIFCVILAVALSIAFSHFSTSSHKELSYFVEGPKDISAEISEGLKKEYNTSTVYEYKVYLKNTGDLPLKNIAVTYDFEPYPIGFEIMNRIHSPTNKESGKISYDVGDVYYSRFIYELLNPKEEIIASFWTNEKAFTFNVLSHTEGVNLNNMGLLVFWFRKYSFAIKVGLISLFTLLLNALLTRAFGRKPIDQQPFYQYNRLTMIGRLIINKAGKGIKVSLEDFATIGESGEIKNQVRVLEDEYKWIIRDGNFIEITKKGKDALDLCKKASDDSITYI